MIDFPFWSSKTRALYLIKNKVVNEVEGEYRFSSSSVRRITRKLNFTYRCPGAKLSPPQRNILGFMAARVVWWTILLDIVNTKHSLITFADECSVCYTELTRGYYKLIGVMPELVHSMRKVVFNTLLLVVPGFGIIYEINRDHTDHHIYIEFLTKAFRVVKSLICLPSDEIILIHDNAPYHCHKEVSPAISALGVEEVPIIPYSPQLNEPAECCFGLTKQNVADIKFNESVNNEVLMLEAIDIWKTQLMKYDAKMSAKYFSMWIKIMEECRNGIELTDKSFNDLKDYTSQLRSFNTIRLK